MGKAGKIVRLVRVMRIMRIFKLVRHFAGLQSLIYTLNQVQTYSAWVQTYSAWTGISEWHELNRFFTCGFIFPFSGVQRAWSADAARWSGGPDLLQSGLLCGEGQPQWKLVKREPGAHVFNRFYAKAVNGNMIEFLGWLKNMLKLQIAMKNLLYRSFLDSFWWGLMTLTTVGYGDLSPSTFPGKLIGTKCCVTRWYLGFTNPVPRSIDLRTVQDWSTFKGTNYRCPIQYIGASSSSIETFCLTKNEWTVSTIIRSSKRSFLWEISACLFEDKEDCLLPPCKQNN